VGSCGLYDGDPGAITYANLFMRIRIDTARFEPWFVQYWLMTPLVREHVKKQTKGTGPSIQKSNGQGVRSIPLPNSVSREDQRWWITHLDSLHLLRVPEILT
jgi:hypothetical protein